MPPPEIRRLRDLTRLHKAQIEERTRAIQRLEKVLQTAGIKLTSVASAAYSVSARAILEALLGGVTDPHRRRAARARRCGLGHHGARAAQERGPRAG